jgi:hypothetical protein
MARITYRDRLSVLIANPAISPRDRTFAASLLSYYERKGRLSAGRVKWVATLEERYSPENLAAASEKHAGMLGRLESLQARTEPSSWANGFVESLIGQVKGDRRLSERQLVTLKKIESEHGDDAMSDRQNWIESYKNDPTLKEKAEVAARYYKTTGYFAATVHNILASDTFVPTFAQYNKMVKNKYAQKVLTAHYADPKYDAGQLVSFRAGCPTANRRCGSGYLHMTVPMMVIAADAGPITTAARGSKVYKVLPIGKAETLLIEERWIMKARKLGAKKKTAENPS